MASNQEQKFRFLRQFKILPVKYRAYVYSDLAISSVTKVFVIKLNFQDGTYGITTFFIKNHFTNDRLCTEIYLKTNKIKSRHGRATFVIIAQKVAQSRSGKFGRAQGRKVAQNRDIIAHLATLR